MNNEEEKIISTEETKIETVEQNEEVVGDYKEKIKGIVFVTWFIASIISIVYLSSYSELYAIIAFGQVFFGFGFIPLTQERGFKRLIGLPFSIIGLAMIIVPYLITHPNLFEFTIVWDSIIPLLFVLIFVLAGLVMISFPIIKRQKLKKVCSETVYATIVEHDYTYNGGKKLYCPIYSFEFNNQKYEVSNNQYSNFGIKPIGTILRLKINPNNPNEFLDERNWYLLIIILGMCFLLMSVPILIHIITTYDFIQ